jgi:hypothetical protein
VPWEYLRKVSWKLIKNEKNEKKLDFYTSTKSISRSGYVMEGKTEFLTNFKKQFIPKVEMLQKEFQSLCNFSFLKIIFELLVILERKDSVHAQWLLGNLSNPTIYS